MSAQKQSVKRNYFQIRADLMARGLTLSMWAKKRGYPATTVYSAAKGERGGAVSRRIINELQEDNA